MKKVLLIGKFNDTLEGINKYLTNYFQVQVCIDNIELIKGMLKINKPDVIVINLMDMDAAQLDIFSMIKLDYFDIPAICLGTPADPAEFVHVIKDAHFMVLKTFENRESILEVIYKELHIDYEVETSIIAKSFGKKKYVLIVDDSPIQLRTMNEMLKDKYEVGMATSGVKALTMIGQRLPDAIFLDYDMPICDGRMTLQMIREIEEAKEIPVIFLTGIKDREHIQAVLELHPAGYLLKPATARTVMGALQKIFYAPIKKEYK